MLAKFKWFLEFVIDRDKIADSMLYICLLLMLSSSVAAILYIIVSSTINNEPRVFAFQLISGSSLIISQVFAVAGLIFWSSSRSKE